MPASQWWADLPAPSRRSPAVELGPRARRTVQAILENARRLFLDRGYHATSIEDITSSAGVSRASFWTYFASKQDVLRSLGENIEPEGLEVARQFEELPVGASLDEVTEWVRKHLAFLDTYGAFIHTAYQAAESDPELRQWVLDTELVGAKALGDGLSHVRAEPGQRGIDPVVQGLAVLSMFERFWYQWRVAGLELDEDAVARSLAQLVWGSTQG
ncbi:TetR/AcrR family transcriptional regulator [Mycobacterium sp.]|uniref:TetR/AcrR family transcriptional regulator n=1 Tax=Mycobacterium sp. TaxID=1785 RepID=UPI003D0B360E